jgi:hypothetical protein
VNIAELIVKLIEVIAWPAIALIALIMLRKPLAELIPLARRVRYRDLELEFEQEVQELRAEAAEELPEAEAERVASEAAVEARLKQMTRVSPSSAILEGWNELERAAVRLIMHHEIDIDPDDPAPLKQIERILEELIDTPKVKIFGDLRRLRNKVAHAPRYDVSPRQAAAYVDVALKLKRYLDAQCEQ